MLPALPTGRHVHVRGVAERVDDLERGGLLPCDADRVHRVDQRHRVLARTARGPAAGSRRSCPSTCRMRRAVGQRLAQLAQRDLAVRDQHRADHARRAPRRRRPRRWCCRWRRRSPPWRRPRAALEIAIVMPRSLNEPVGFAPSTLRYTSQPVSSDEHGAGTSGVPPSPQRDHRGVGGRPAAGRGTPRSRRATWARHGPRSLIGVIAMLATPSTRITLATSRTDVESRAQPVHRRAPAPRRWPRWVTITSVRVVAAAGLAHGLDRHVRARRSTGATCGQHAGLVGHVEADVVAGARLAHRAAPRSSAYADSPGPRPPVDPVAAHRDQVAEHRAGGRRAAGAPAVEHQLAGRLGLDEHRVVRLARPRPAGGVRGIIAGCTRAPMTGLAVGVHARRSPAA